MSVLRTEERPVARPLFHPTHAPIIMLDNHNQLIAHSPVALPPSLHPLFLASSLHIFCFKNPCHPTTSVPPPSCVLFLNDITSSSYGGEETWANKLSTREEILIAIALGEFNPLLRRLRVKEGRGRRVGGGRRE